MKLTAYDTGGISVIAICRFLLNSDRANCNADADGDADGDACGCNVTGSATPAGATLPQLAVSQISEPGFSSSSTHASLHLLLSIQGLFVASRGMTQEITYVEFKSAY